MIKHNWKKWLACACLLVLCLALFKEAALADVGNSFSGGGGSSGGSYGGSYGSGGSFFTFLPFVMSPSGLIILLVVIAFVAFFTKQKGNPNRRTMGGVNSYSSPGFSSNIGLNEDAVVSRIKENDPNFAAEPFKTYVKEVYIQVQEAWEQKKWNQIRPFESNALFNVHSRQLQEYIDMKQTNYMNRQNIRSCVIADYRMDGEYEVVTVKLDASLLDYVLDDETGKLIEGSKSEYQHRSYRLEFLRKNVVKTKAEEGISTTNCPNCGAPTEVTSAGQCEFCQSIITSGDYGWVLNHYGKW